MFYNLKAEMVRRNVTVSDIGRVINKTSRSVRDKISGRYPFTYVEAKTVRNAYFQGLDLETLFDAGEQDQKAAP